MSKVLVAYYAEYFSINSIITEKLHGDHLQSKDLILYQEHIAKVYDKNNPIPGMTTAGGITIYAITELDD